METTNSHTYAAPIAAVVKMLADPEAVTQRYSNMGHHDIEIRQCELTGDSLIVESSRVVDVELPGFAKKVLSPTNTMVQRDEWSIDGDGWVGTFKVDVAGAPLQMHGKMSLRPDGDETIHEVTLTLNVKVPLVGGKVADWVGKNEVPKTMAAEFESGDTWLASQS